MPKSALEKAMDCLALRPLSTSELRTKLSSAGRYTPEEIGETIEICRNRGYLNDSLLAADAAQFLSSCGKGRGLIRQKLRTRGIGEEELSEALEAITPENESAAARSAAAGKMRLLVREKDRRKKREKLFRFLISRGFSLDLVHTTVSELLAAEEEENESPEQ